MKQKRLKAPFGWVGGKSKLAKDIVELMPKHRLYAEVFGGALNVLYAKPKPSNGKQAEVVNDINGDCDPPYVETEAYYKNTGGFGIKEHELLADSLKRSNAKFLLSYNDCRIVRELYKDFNIMSTREIDYTLGKNVHGKSKKVKEVVITNY